MELTAKKGPRLEAEILQTARDAVAGALKAGADLAEAYIHSSRGVDVSFEKSDVRSSSAEEETFLGLRLFKKNCLGFSATNCLDKEGLDEAAKEALALAAHGVPDPHNKLAPKGAVLKGPSMWNEEVAALDVGAVTEKGSAWLRQTLALDPRLGVDSGGFSAGSGTWALANSLGLEQSSRGSQLSGTVFGMAKEGDQVGSFAYDWFMTRELKGLEKKLEDSASIFAKKALGALNARKGESFRGPAVLDPEVVLEVLVGPLLYGMDASSVRKGRSRLAGKVGSAVASPHFHLDDLGPDPRGASASPFDREGVAKTARPLVEGGELRTYLYNVYEASQAGREPTGHAAGGARSAPGIGAGMLRLKAGNKPSSKLLDGESKAVYITRFSGQADPISGEVSGVIKGGFLVKGGERIPIQETLVHGRLDEMLKNVSALGAEEKTYGDFISPEVRVEDLEFSTG